MAVLVKSISPVPIADPNLPIALRPALDFSPRRGSIFDDPGDERSWHVSQRAEGLSEYYAGRDPSWYAAAIAPLAGAERVLDLGCGPGLALRALRGQGSSSVLGIDRWPAFAAKSTPEAPIVAHDLTLPMPFLESGSFDGVLSHYALDYVSPICARQVLREAHRVLAPGGRLVLYLAAIGLAGGDESRTIPYSPPVVRTLLAEAGFDEVEVGESSNGRNTVARARRGDGAAGAQPPGEPWTRIGGDTQLSAAFRSGDSLRLELAGAGGTVTFRVELPSPGVGDGSRVAVCARTQRRRGGGTELQLWAWRGFAPLVAERALVELDAEEMRIAVGGAAAEHASAWSPAELSLEPRGNAYARIADLPEGGELSEAERGAEGRQIVVESAADAAVGWDRLGPGRNRFLVRPASRLDLATLDREWLAGKLHGVAVTADELGAGGLRELLLWTGWRQSLLYLEGADWAEILAAAEQRQAEMGGAVVLVDPALAASPPPASPDAGIVAFAAAHDRAFVLLGASSHKRTSAADLVALAGRLLLAGPAAPGPEVGDADESLRHLTERALLMRLRQAHGYSPAEVGRREAGP